MVILLKGSLFITELSGVSDFTSFHRDNLLLPVFINKKNPPYGGFISLRGAAGSRTRVQTVSRIAFYMLSFQLIVG